MFTPSSLLAKTVVACAIVLACAVPVFAANSFNSGNNTDAGASTVSSPKPAGLAVGDVMIASVQVNSDSVTITTPPLGWNLITDRLGTAPGGNTDVRLATYWKTADAADVAAANFQWGLSGSARAFAGVARYDDVAVTGGPATPVAAQVTNPAGNGSAPSDNDMVATGVTTTQPGSYVTAIYAMNAGTAINTAPGGMTPLYNNGRTTGTDPGRLAAYDVSQAAVGASGNKTAIAANNVRYVTQTIALKPKPTKLGFSTPARTGVVDGCLGPITVQTQNSAGGAVNPLSSTEVNLATDGTGDFFENAACDDALDQADRTIGTGATSTADIYYKPIARGSGSHTITATDAATVLTQAQQVQTVKLAQTITFAQPTSPQIYGDDFDIGPATSDSALTVTVTPSGGCSLVGTTATMTSGTADCVLTASQAGDSTYAAAPNVVRTVNADPRPITVTVDPNQSKVYNNNGADPALTYQVTSGSLVGSDVFSGALARAAGTTVAGGPYAINQGTLSAGTKYALTFVGDNFAITARPLSMNGNNASKTYGDLDPAFSATLSNFASGHNNRNQAGVTGTESCTRAPLDEDAGTYTDSITCAQGTLASANGNYSFAAGTSGDFTIDPKELTVDADPGTKTYGDADPVFTATLNGFAFSETPATANVTGAAACSRAGTDEDVGTYAGVLSCVPDTLAAPNYTFAPVGASADFTVTKRTAHVTSTVADKVYNQTTAAQILTSVLTNRAPGETATEVDFTGALSAAFATASAGQDKPVDVTGSPTLTGTKAANYDIAVDDATADINPLQLTPSFTAASKVYDGGAAAGVTGRSLTGVLSPDAVSLSGGTATFASKTVGNGKTVTLDNATLTGAQAGNYSLPAADPTTTASITPKSVTGGFTVAAKDFDGTTAATITGRSVTGAVAGDAIALTGGTATFADANPGVGKTVTGAGFALGGADAGNYALGSVGTTTATIRQRPPAGSDPPPGDNPPPAKDLTQDAEKLLGGDVKSLNFSLGGLAFAFAPADQAGTVKVGKGGFVLFAIGGCDTACTIDVGKTLVLTGDAAASAAKTRRIKLKAQKLSLAAGELAVVKLKLSKKQRKAIKKAKKAKLVVKATVQAGARKTTDKKSWKLKLKKA